jgi:hypothetical protein
VARYMFRISSQLQHLLVRDIHISFILRTMTRRTGQLLPQNSIRAKQRNSNSLRQSFRKVGTIMNIFGPSWDASGAEAKEVTKKNIPIFKVWSNLFLSLSICDSVQMRKLYAFFIILQKMRN